VPILRIDGKLCGWSAKIKSVCCNIAVNMMNIQCAGHCDRRLVSWPFDSPPPPPRTPWWWRFITAISRTNEWSLSGTFLFVITVTGSGRHYNAEIYKRFYTPNPSRIITAIMEALICFAGRLIVFYISFFFFFYPQRISITEFNII